MIFNVFLQKLAKSVDVLKLQQANGDVSWDTVLF